jgi:hypothetical protein
MLSAYTASNAIYLCLALGPIVGLLVVEKKVALMH